MATKEHVGIRKLALELGDMSFADRQYELNFWAHRLKSNATECVSAEEKR